MELKKLNLRMVADLLTAVDPPLETRTTETTVKRHIDGDNHPSPDYVRRYLVITERAVGPADWYELAMERLAESRPPDSPPLQSVASA